MAQMVGPGGSVLGLEKVPELVERSKQSVGTWWAVELAGGQRGMRAGVAARALHWPAAARWGVHQHRPQ
jgi:hypothetical protein